MTGVRELAETIYRTEQMALGHATTPQVTSTSVVGGGIEFKDEDGNLLAVLGQDAGRTGVGLNYVSVPLPPQPTVPVVSSDANIVNVAHDGLWVTMEGAETEPDTSGVDHLEVHVGDVDGFVPDPLVTLKGSLPFNQAGASMVIGPFAEAGDYFVALMGRSKTGEYGPVSECAPVHVPIGSVADELMGTWLKADEAMVAADGKSRVFYGDDPEGFEPEDGFRDGDLWFDTSTDPDTGRVKNLPSVFSEESGGWVSVADDRVRTLEEAQAKLREDLSHVVVTGGGNTLTWNPSRPGDAAGVEGDTWYVTEGDRIVEQWSYVDGGWVQRVIDQQVIGELDAGKIQSGFIDAKRIEAGSLVADLVLLEGSLGSTILAPGAVTTEKLAAGAITAESGIIGSLDLGVATVGTLDGKKIRANTIASEQIAAGAIRGVSLAGDAIDGKTITGAVIRTSASGARVQMDFAGLHSWSKDNTKTFDIDSTTGEVSMIGALRAGNANDYRVVIDKTNFGTSDTSGPTINFEAPEGNTVNTAYIGYQAMGAGADRGLVLQSPAAGSAVKTFLGVWPGSTEMQGIDSRGSSRVNAGIYGGEDDYEDGGGFAALVFDEDEWYCSRVIANEDAIQLETTGYTGYQGSGSRLALGRAKEQVAAGKYECGALFAAGDRGYLQIQSYAPSSSRGDTVPKVDMVAGNQRFQMNGKTNRMSLVYGPTNSEENTLGLGQSTGMEITYELVRFANFDCVFELTPSNMFGMQTSSANLGRYTYTGTGANWGWRYYQGNDWYGEIGSPGGTANASDFGFAASNRSMSFVVASGGSHGHIFPNHLTSTAAANVSLDAKGVLRRNTSTRASKLNEREAVDEIEGFDDKLLSIPLKLWHDKEAVEAYARHLDGEDGEVPPAVFDRVIGMVAEDVEAAGLPQLVIHGEDGKPEGLAYDRFGPAAVSALSRFRDETRQKIATLEARVEALEAAVAA